MDISRAGQALLRSRWLATAPFHHIQPRSGPQFFARTLSSWHNPSGQYVLGTSSASRSYSQHAAASIPPEDNEKRPEPSNRHESSRSATTTTSSSAPTLQAQQQTGSPVKLEDDFNVIMDDYNRQKSSAQQAAAAFRSQKKEPRLFNEWAGRGSSEPKRRYEQKTKLSEISDALKFAGKNGSSWERGVLSPTRIGQPFTHIDYSKIETQMEYPRLNANLGRVVDMKANKMDLAQGLGKLDALVRQNRIRTMARIQRFHERPGLKRKRLKSERWRVRFKDGFKHITRRVTRFVNQGW